MNPICVLCVTEMVCAKNGISVAPAHAPHHTRRGDKYRCPECGVEVIMGLSRQAYEEEKEADLLVEYN